MTTLRSLVLACAWLLSGAVLADSYIYVTNNTPETVTISVDHHGSRTLSQGSQWNQEASEIPPYETRKVLGFNRYWGVSRGHTFNFDTYVSNGDATVVLQQSMVGTWSGSNIVHSARGDDFDAPWYSDRHIHRHATDYAGQQAQVAMKAHYTGGYDDFYYTIHNLTQPEPISDAGELKVLSYNIYALPFVADKIGERLDQLPHHLHGYDVILFQEAFDSRREGFLLTLAQEYPYQTHVPRVSFWDNSQMNIFDSGVLIASRYPIAQVADYIYPDCAGTDCMADKGVIYAEILKDGQAYHLTSTHAASFDTDEARALRMEQFQQIRDLVDTQSIPAWEPLLFGGDFNVNKLKWQDDYAQMQAILNATDPQSQGHDATFDPRINVLAQAYGSGGDLVEYLDYVLYANDHLQPQAASNEVRIPRSTADGIWGIWDLSDHFPVLGTFRYQ